MIAIIPARAGSKGLPAKNIKLLKGLPLIAYTIMAAKKAKCIDRVIVSTEDSNIAEIAQKHGAEVPFFRPAGLAQDDSKAIDVYLYTIERLEETQEITVNDVCILLPTCPLRTWRDIEAANSIYLENNADSVISYTQESHPVFWHKFIDNDNKFINIFEDNVLNNRQELRISYYPNGAIYIFKTAILKKRKYYTDRSYAYIMPRERSVDIDTPADLAYAEVLLNQAGK
ncbi:MAG: acylneuraminate cytidylyltransferase family protein [Bacteroidales bacterium]|nr:acylneuraminate cytidylyltransferase family protein [Bacteroidales bacterium]